MPGIYRPRHPERSVLYRVLFHHFERFVAEYEERFEKAYGYFRPIIKDVVEKYLDCGNPRCGFARIRCPDCRAEGPLRGSFLVLDIDSRLDLSFFRDGRCRCQAQQDMIRDNMEKEITITNPIIKWRYPMKTDYSGTIRTSLEPKSSDELLHIWNKNDRNEWSPEAFDVIQSILRERGVSFEPQPTSPLAAPPPLTITPMWKRIISTILLLLGVVILFWHSSKIIALKLLESEQLVNFNSGAIAVTAIFTFGLVIAGATLWRRWPVVTGIISLGLGALYLALSLMKLENPASELERVRSSAFGVVGVAGILIGLVLILTGRPFPAFWRQRTQNKPSRNPTEKSN